MPEEEKPNWEDELTAEQLDRFLSLQDDPVALVSALREDTELLVALARADTRPTLVTWFSEQLVTGNETGWTHDPERSGAVGEAAAGVEWSWHGVHDDTGKAGAFNSTTGSDRRVTVHGFTLMGVEADEFLVRRYVDWAGVFAQLGFSLNWRTPVQPEPS